MKSFTDNQITEFTSLVQSKLPRYIIVHIEDNEVVGDLRAKFEFPDGSNVSYAYHIKQDTELDEALARHLINSIIDISVTNLNAHLKMLQDLKDKVNNN